MRACTSMKRCYAILWGECQNQTRLEATSGDVLLIYPVEYLQMFHEDNKCKTEKW